MTNFLKTIALSYLLVSSPTFASESPGVTSDVVLSQVEISKAAVESVSRTISEETNLGNFNLRDYKAQVGEFKDKLERALIEFNDIMEYLILNRTKELVDHYNSIYHSPNFSNEQKRVILKKQFQEITNEMNELSQRYQEAIRILLSSTGDFLFDYEFRGYDLSSDEPSKAEKIIKKWARENGLHDSKYHVIHYPQFLKSGVEHKPTKKRDRSSWNYSELTDFSKSSWKVEDFKNGLRYQKSLFHKPSNSTWGSLYRNYSQTIPNDVLFLPHLIEQDADQYYSHQFSIIRGTCESQLCVGLRGADILLFFKEVREKLDLEMIFELADGNFITLQNYKFSEYLVAYFVGRTDFPVELPFDTE
ncbi:MAG: hypothetical protein VX642_07715 [Bdellovibrionota bacterium]|nr:hypothetical protein [Bdellovibrionota bacterium]